jgi:hypothetical protein
VDVDGEIEVDEGEEQETTNISKQKRLQQGWSAATSLSSMTQVFLVSTRYVSAKPAVAMAALRSTDSLGRPPIEPARPKHIVSIN